MKGRMKLTHGGDVYRNPDCIDFSANINPLGIPEGVKRAMLESIEQVQNYPDICCEALVEEIAGFHGIEKGQIVCGNGAADLIFRYVFAIKPKRALVMDPCFLEYEQALEFVGAEVLHYPLDRKSFCLEKGMIEALTDELEVIFLCNPNNPTGKLIPAELLEQILGVCREKNIRLFMDECFLDFVSKEKKQAKERSLISRLAGEPHLFILKSFTKMYAIPGVRLGYGMTSDRKLLYNMERAGAPWSVSVLAQAAGVAALKSKDFVEQTCLYIEEEKEYLYRNLERLGICFWRSSGNFILLYDERELQEKLLEKGILIRDCGNYSGLSKGYYRIAVKDRKSNQQLIRRLEELEEK